jgi:hypothetical protein
MNSRRVMTWVFAAATFAALAAAGCGQPVSVSVATPNPCAGDTAPEIGQPVFVVRDPASAPYNVLPASSDGFFHIKRANAVAVNNMVVLWFRYKDAQCNLNGGEIYWGLDQTQFVPVVTIAMPAADACDGEPLASFVQAPVTAAVAKLPGGYGYIVPMAIFSSIDCGPHDFHLGVADACGKDSTSTIAYRVYLDC